MLTSNPSLRSKSQRACIKVAHVEFFQGDARLVPRLCCDCDLWEPRMRNTNLFFSLGRKSKAKEQFYNNDFRKAVVFNSIADALRHLHTSKCKRPHTRFYDVCLWNPTERNKVRTSKQLRFAASTETFNGNQAKKIDKSIVVWQSESTTWCLKSSMLLNVPQTNITQSLHM